MYGANENTGAHAASVERAAGCHERQSNLTHEGLTFDRPSQAHLRPAVTRTNRVTGQKYIDAPRRSPMPEGQLKYPVVGLRVFPGSNGVTSTFEFVSKDPIDESDAIDAQCRAGWDDRGYGFYEFHTGKLPDGTYVAVWQAAVSCE